jgi:YspA, cpYpsA-related SLOG family
MGMVVRILFCGSRDLSSSYRIWQTLQKIVSDSGTSHTIVHGAARGADQMAAWYAARLGFQVEAHPARWKEYGKRAGYLRNKEMLDSGLDVVYAFTEGPLKSSRGTAMMVKIVQEAGLPVHVTEQ